jgi:hypothetical protein
MKTNIFRKNEFNLLIFTFIIVFISNDRNHTDHVKLLYADLSSSILYTTRLRSSDIV